MRQRLDESKNYAQLVLEVAAQAAAGDPQAAYVTGEALKWCGQTLRLYFIRPGGEIRTLENVHAMWVSKPNGPSPELLTKIYTRCMGFLTNSSFLTNKDLWKPWLEKA